ncbi:sulfite exporter TauE/SafE family protein [Psychrobacter sp. I-STPA10]|uniref:sulfite exporter TauE/SafE family protein n=1 Tax=Psychrobacter sp. I-STPA10 TaxID=2585769 RepID=UPI001E40921C|nr:sulfite exporter TauE/SafE family protein [Psychrobacter sp. I-STPA10]
MINSILSLLSLPHDLSLHLPFHLSVWLMLALFTVGIIAFIISTVSGGGGALLLIPIVTFLIGAPAAPPVINLGTFIGRPVRLYLFWQDIKWQLVLYYVPSALIGATLAGLLFSRLNAHWIQLIVGIFLLSTVLQYRFGKVDKTFDIPLKGFIALGFLVAFISTLVGGLGPVMNPFYMNAGLQKEDLVATKTANAFFVGIAQLGSYTFFGILTPTLWLYGLILGLGAVVGNIIGKRCLSYMSARQFRFALILLMMMSGIVMIANNWQFIFT